MSPSDPVVERPGCPFGTHRVIAPQGSLPQAADRLDNDFSQVFDSEILLDVQVLNLDAASFRQLREVAEDDPRRVGEQVLSTVRSRGKQHNPVTGSGGMLLGRVRRVGSAVPAQVAVGERIASLVSLTLTPLAIQQVLSVHLETGQIDVEARAVLFSSSAFAVMPEDIPERTALAALDVCGAPAQVARSLRPGQSVLILGAGGKSGLLCAAQARSAVGSQGRVVGVESSPRAARVLRDLGFCDEVLEADARDPLSLRQAVLGANGGAECDFVVSCVNVPAAELGAVLCCKERGTVFFFAMTTSFTGAALGAEGVGKDVNMLIGNGFARGHAEQTLALLRREPRLRAVFESRHGETAQGPDTK